jgi:hypothetical protein
MRDKKAKKQAAGVGVEKRWLRSLLKTNSFRQWLGTSLLLQCLTSLLFNAIVFRLGKMNRLRMMYSLARERACESDVL